MANPLQGSNLIRRWRRVSHLLPAAAAMLGLAAGLIFAALAAPSPDGPAQASTFAAEAVSDRAALDVVREPVPTEAFEPPAVMTEPAPRDEPSPVAEASAPAVSAPPLTNPAEFVPAPDPAASDAILIADRVAIERPLSALAPRAVDFLVTRQGRVSVAVIDLSDGSAYYYGRSQRYELVSVAKVAILVSFLERAHMGRHELTAYEQLQLHDMIAFSDNDATTAIWARSGRVSGVGGIMNRIGLGGSRIDVIGADWGGMTATAMDVALLFAEVGDGRVLSEESRARALTLLEGIGEEQTWGVSAGFSSHGGTGDRLAFKNGWWFYPESLDWVVHSAAVVTDADGAARYAIAIMSDGQPTYPYGIETIEGIAREIHQAFLPLGIRPLAIAFWR